MATAFAERSFLGTFGLVFLSIAALFATDTFLVKTERAANLVEAARLFEQALVLMQRGENAEAIERIKDAILIERDNRYYQRTLAQAQLAAGKSADAESTLTELLQSDSTDGLTNLIMGRVLVKDVLVELVGVEGEPEDSPQEEGHRVVDQPQGRCREKCSNRFG